MILECVLVEEVKWRREERRWRSGGDKEEVEKYRREEKSRRKYCCSGVALEQRRIGRFIKN